MNYILDKTVRMKTFFITCIMMFILYLAGNMSYDTNDDMAMIAIVSGQYANIALPDGIFLSPLLSFILYYCYKVIPYLPWYGMILYLYQFIGCYCFYSIVRLVFKNNKSKIIVIISFLALYAYIFYRLNFSSTSLFLWFSALVYLIAVLLLRGKENSKSVLLFCGFAMGLSYLLRPSILTIAIAFSIPLFIIVFKLERLRKVTYLLIPIVILAAMNQYIFMTKINNANYDSFLAYNQVRSDFLDTHKSDRNEKTDDALSHAGWNNEDYKVAKEWWLYDEEIFSTEKICKFLEINARTVISVYDIKNLFKSPFVILICASLLICQFKTKFLAIPDDKKRFVHDILIKSIGIIILLTVALSMIRFPMRVKVPIYIFILCYVILLQITKPKEVNLQSRYSKKWKYLLLAAIITTFMISHNKLVKSTQEDYKFQQYTIESYNSVIELQTADTIFVPLNIRTIINTVSPLSEYNSLPHYNSIPAGWLIRSPIYYQYIQKLGLDNGSELTRYMINNDKIVLTYYWSPEDNQLIEDFVEFINQHYSPFGKRLALEMVMDKRKSSDKGKEGWVFYKIATQNL